ncbi:hypothetical protein ACLKA6_014494 [Drosophila palustris]
MSDSNGQETNGREANGQPPTKVRKINFTTNHDEPENSSEVTELRREIDGLKKVVEELTESMKTVIDVNKEVKAEIRNANNLKDDGHKAKVITEAIVFMV